MNIKKKLETYLYENLETKEKSLNDLSDANMQYSKLPEELENISDNAKEITRVNRKTRRICEPAVLQPVF